MPVACYYTRTFGALCTPYHNVPIIIGKMHYNIKQIWHILTSITSACNKWKHVIYLSIQRRENDDMAFCQLHPPIGLQIHHTTGSSILPSECFIYTSVQHTSRALSDILSSDVIIFIDVCQLILTFGSENWQYFLGMSGQNTYKWQNLGDFFLDNAEPRD